MAEAASGEVTSALAVRVAMGAVVAAWVWRHATSVAVRNWKRPSGRRVCTGALSVRVAGTGDPVFVLLHGLTASGDTFGGDFDRLTEDGTIVVPDLLGFGRSLDLDRDDFSLGVHLQALDLMLESLEIAEARLVVVGHSMGSLLALHWAAQRPRVERVVTFCAPLYETEVEARRHISRMGPLESLFAMESPLARWTCAAMCAARAVAQWVAVAIAPQWPMPIARQGVLHTWPAYLGGMNDIILRAGWREALEKLASRGVPVVVADGGRDPVPVPGRAHQLAAHLDTVYALGHPNAAHDLPVSYANWAVDVVLAEPSVIGEGPTP